MPKYLPTVTVELNGVDVDIDVEVDIPNDDCLSEIEVGDAAGYYGLDILEQFTDDELLEAIHNKDVIEAYAREHFGLVGLED